MTTYRKIEPQNLEFIQGKTSGHLKGGVYLDKTIKKKILLKFPHDEEEARNEVLATKLYQLTGVKTAEQELVLFEEKVAVVSIWLEKFTILGNSSVPLDVTGLHENFVIDAWLANWDVIGKYYDNIGFVGKETVRIDMGGSLFYRGKRGLKGNRFSDNVDEICDMLDPKVSYNPSLIFARTTIEDFINASDRINKLPTSTIEDLINQYGPQEKDKQKELFDILDFRRGNLIQQFSDCCEWQYFLSGHIDIKSSLKAVICRLQEEE